MRHPAGRRALITDPYLLGLNLAELARCYLKAGRVDRSIDSNEARESKLLRVRPILERATNPNVERGSPSNADVLRHRDYWDADSVVYERIPVLGWLVRYVKRRIGGY